MPTPEQFKAALDRQTQAVLDAIEGAKEANEAALASIARGKKRIKKLRRKGTRKGSSRRGRRSRKH
jgi:hypothetical protein